MNTMKKISALLLCLILTAVQLISAAALADANTRVIVSPGIRTGSRTAPKKPGREC